MNITNIQRHIPLVEEGFSPPPNPYTYFYEDNDCLKKTGDDLHSARLPVSYTYNTERRSSRVAKEILSVIFFPIKIGQLFHSLGGKIILPASGYDSKLVERARSKMFTHKGGWQFKRITIATDGYEIDAMIVGKIYTLNNGRWVLASNGNGQIYECFTGSSGAELRKILTKIEGNAIIFNYPGVGASSGLPNRRAMTKAYRAVLNFLEDKKDGIGAKEIVGYGFSIGGGIQGDALRDHTLKADINYVFVKSKTFTDLSTTASYLIGPPLGFLVRVLGWNISSVESSKKLQAYEIIIQTATGAEDARVLTRGSDVEDDGIIPPESALAKKLLEDPTCPRENKLFIGTNKGHCEDFSDVTLLTDAIKQMLASSGGSEDTSSELETVA